MPIPITVPRLGWTMDEGVFEGWLKQDGEVVQAGEPLFALEGEKATQDIEAIDSGVLRIPPDGPKPGDVVPVGAVLAYLLAPGEVSPWESGEGVAASGASPVGNESPKSTTETTPAPVRSTMPRVGAERTPTAPSASPTISPRALRIAQELGIDWTQIRGTGRTGRIRERDIRANVEKCTPDQPLPIATQPTSAPVGGRIVALTPIRKTIAARMRAGLALTAPVTLTTDCDVTNLVQLRRQLQRVDATAGTDRASNDSTPSSAAEAAHQVSAPTYTDLIVKLTAAALQQHPMLTGQWTEQGIIVPDRIDVNVAIETEGGLIAPLIRDVPGLTLQQVAATMRALIDGAHARRMTAEQLASGSFTISNLGMYGIDAFTPILNAPQTAILGIGRIRRMPAVVQDQIVPRDCMAISLTFDHRVVDGVPAAKFLNTLRSLLESPA